MNSDTPEQSARLERNNMFARESDRRRYPALKFCGPGPKKTNCLIA